MPKFQVGMPWGQVTRTTGGMTISTFALNGAASGGYSVNWLAVGMVPLLGGTVSKVRIRCTAVNGTLGASDLVCDIYSDSAGNPNSSLQSSATVTTTPTGAAWVEFTGFSTALTVGTNYWFVFRNANGTPTSNYPTYGYLDSTMVMSNTTDPGIGQGLIYASTNSGSTWTRATSVGLMVVDYGGGSIEGFPIQSIETAAPLEVYSSREAGVKFTTPADSGLNVIGVCALASKSGTPTGELRYRIYTGSSTTPTLAGTTVTRPASAINSGRTMKPLHFSSPVAIAAGTVVRVVLSETTQSDTSSNRFQMEYAVLSSADTGILMPFAVQPERTLSTDGGANFTDTANAWPPIWLILDGNDPFPAASGGGLMVHPGMSGGMRA